MTTATNLEALVIMATHDGAASVEAALGSIVASVERWHVAGGARGAVAISVVDDGSSDDTPTRIAAFAANASVPMLHTTLAANRGRGHARNLAAAAAGTKCYMFLDQDDEFLPEHVCACLYALAANPRADFIETDVHLDDPVHPRWADAIRRSLLQTTCVRAHAHRLIGGLHEERAVQIVGCDDVLYKRQLRTHFRGFDVNRSTVRFRRRPGNSFDRQYERKFSRSPEHAENTLTPDRLDQMAAVERVHHERSREVAARLRRLRSICGRPPR